MSISLRTCPAMKGGGVLDAPLTQPRRSPMRSGHVRPLLLAAVLFANVAGADAPASNRPTLGTEAAAAATPARGGTVPGIDAARPPSTASRSTRPTVATAMVDRGEQCDDGNKTPGDGCSAICQIPAGWTCTGSPSVCTMAGVCGDGILGASEACDDKNMTGGDGCSADCKTVETGYECRVPGRRCVPACGDGMIIGGGAVRRREHDRRRRLLRRPARSSRARAADRACPASARPPSAATA